MVGGGLLIDGIKMCVLLDMDDGEKLLFDARRGQFARLPMNGFFSL